MAKGKRKTPTRAKVQRTAKPTQVSGLDRARRWLRMFAWSLLIGGALSGAIISAAMYYAALYRVDHRLDTPIWSVPGRIYSAPLEVWEGLAYTPEALTDDLIAAGYTRAERINAAGDFSASTSVVRVSLRTESGPGYQTKAGEVKLSFSDGKISNIEPGQHATFAPAVLATIKGADNENRSPVKLDKLPDHVKQAVLSMEDARFYNHFGVDPLGITRAMFVNAQAGAWVQGGSTLTQQLAKNVFLSSERTGMRKLEEAFLALALERRLSKDQILEMYLNEIYLGQLGGAAICGVEEAARAWFGTSAERLDLAEAATIAGVIAAPNAYSPIRNPDAAKSRRSVVLDRMVAVGVIPASAAEAAKAAPLGVTPRPTDRRAPWAMDMASEVAEDEVGEGSIVRDALRVYTTLNPALQRLAESVIQQGVAELIAQWPRLADVQMALVAVRAKDGAVVAMVGGRSYSESPYNRAVLSKRLIGSTVKPLTTLIAMEADPQLGPATMLEDAPIHRIHDGKDWTPSNYDNAFVGPISLRRALATSRNIPAVLVAERVGMSTLQQRYKAMGLSGATRYPSAALGGFGATPLELAGAYTVFPTGGKVRSPYLVRTVNTTDNQLAWERKAPSMPSYSARATWLAVDMLQEVLRTGTGKAAPKYGVDGAAAGKSGTTDNYTDAWFVGFTPELVVVVWVGFDRNEKVGLTGSQAALPTWARFVAGSGTQGGSFAAPSGLVQVEVCDSTGLPACPGCDASHTEWFSAGQVPEKQCGVFNNPEKAAEKAAEERAERAEPAQGPAQDEGVMKTIGGWFRPKDKN